MCARVELVQDTDRGPLGLAEARAAMVADATAQLLRAAGDVVDRSCDAATAPERSGPSVRVARGGGPVREIAVGPVQVSLNGVPRPATLRVLLDEVGADAARFFLLLDRPQVPLEVDLGLVRRERTDNPLFYIRYAQARLAIVLRAAEGDGMAPDLGRLGAPEDALVRALVSYPDAVDAAADRLEPHRILAYALDLAAAWHRYYNRSTILAEDPALARARLALVRCVQQVLRSAFGVVGCTPERS
jgi:arginyl-tRNA synthetase